MVFGGIFFTVGGRSCLQVDGRGHRLCICVEMYS